MKASKKKLIRLFDDLPETEQQSLLDFAEFLVSRSSENVASQQPEIIAPTENESVVAAIKRLSASYPMLDKGKMLNETSMLMTQHVMQGRDKAEVIEELELVFQRHYQKFQDESGQA